MIDLLYIHWNPDLVIFNIGPLAIRWYSTCWLIGLLLSYFTVRFLYKKQGLPNEKFEPLFLYCFIGILIAPDWVTVCFTNQDTSSPAARTS